MPRPPPRRTTAAAKLTPADVIAIRQKYEAGWTQGALCREYGVTLQSIGRVVRYETWSDITAPPTVEGLDAMAQRLLREQTATQAYMSGEVEQTIRAAAARTDSAAEDIIAALSTPAVERLRKLKGLDHDRPSDAEAQSSSPGAESNEGESAGSENAPDAGYA